MKKELSDAQKDAILTRIMQDAKHEYQTGVEKKEKGEAQKSLEEDLKNLE